MNPRRTHSTGSPMEQAAAYSRAVRVGAFVHVSGTTGYDYASMEMPAGVADQARNCFTTIAASLTALDAELGNIVRVTYYVTKPEHFDAVAPVLREFLGDINPAATMIVCQLIRPEMLIEIEVTAQVA
ncbi:RidA family protein [Hoeflea sp. G2-23]|uniref:RidA family protein n=1 Tax=Hoeflea algicola TaxID=2983763 RepID=A0ABT3ZD74_9HYPH|nr:RidA family protein [Hoeflea algicola]MCY0149732.1 RidA family protein [Hoeflea algicola]